MNTFNNGDRVSYMCGDQWMNAIVQNKIDGEEKLGNLKIFPSNVDPLYKIKLDKDNKTVFQHASALQPEGSQKGNVGLGESSQQFGNIETFNEGEKVGFYYMGKCCCGTVKRGLQNKEQIEGAYFYASKKDPQYIMTCDDGSESIVSASCLKKKEQLEHEKQGTSIKQGSELGLGSQGAGLASSQGSGLESFGSQGQQQSGGGLLPGSQHGQDITTTTGLPLAGSQGGFVGSQHEAVTGSQEQQQQHAVKNVPVE